MDIEDLKILFGEHPELAAVRKALAHNNAHVLLSGLHASARALALAQLRKPLFVIFDNAESAQYIYSDLKTLGADAGFFPSSKRRRTIDDAAVIQRTETLTTLPSIIVTYPEAIAEPVPAKEELSAISFQLKVGQEVKQSDLSIQLSDLGFERVDFVYQPGQYAVRGSIVDVYSYSHDDPYRLDFFGDEIDSIRTFDIEDQLSKNRIDSAEIVGSSKDWTLDIGHWTIVDYLTKETVWVSNDFGMVNFKLSGLGISELGISENRTIEIAEKSTFATHSKIAFDTTPQPVFHKQFDILTDDLKKHIDEGYKIYILAEQQKQLDRLKAIFESLVESTKTKDRPSDSKPLSTLNDSGLSSLSDEVAVSFIGINATLHEGFVDKGLKICCYTDHQIFERFHRVMMSSENARRGKAIITLREINQLQVGDYVVHSDHGIAKFGGLVTTPVNGKPQEMIKLNYRDGANVFVSIHNLHRISKYKGREGSEPTIARLGSGQWERLKERTKDKVKDIARDLIRLYATRKQQKGFAYSPDGYMQHELEASFLYEDTPDQAKATADVKHDLESPMPMDRLVCGDVGFGKTEVAMRAAFKVATDGKQVAVLVPTTVLALQHYNTFTERMKNMPVRIEYLSRLKSAKETKEILDELEAGKIDILIGTHKLIGKSVKWHDLGLLIIDEEQKFGVAAKEKLKSLRTNVDVLTLTATPIPRTLQFSLLGARDLSIMTTPPQNRYPVQTELITVNDEDIIKEAIELEMGRNGQIFIVNNRIEMLPRIEHKIHKLCPEARIVVAHGQLPAGEMEERLEAFINYDYDILLSTTIIESGVDIPNVNTILIFSADKYGLADLHQLRGRVGRSNRKAYCYLIAPERELLTEDARRRLEALSTFAELGAGFNLAMQDLDIRGAGNMLGSEQSGFIADLGYETYQRILNEAMEELREEEGSIGSTPEQPFGFGASQDHRWCQDAQLETDIPVCFPTEYIENISERITLYRELDSLHSEEQLLDFRKKLIDRFGVLPEPAEELLEVVRLRWLCCRLGVEKILLKGERMTMYLVQHKEAYWQSEMFGNIVQYAVTRPERCTLHEEKDKKGLPTGRRMVTITNVRSIGGAITLLSKIERNEL
ncbi:MAG: transcription-repair coupling factor [Bacteroidales bacterium]|nr:transcription-repair coupling factor [Bacteroidales bacterium]MDY6406670.1 transcription-repair coupling factor [Bacteroidales bacterium]